MPDAFKLSGKTLSGNALPIYLNLSKNTNVFIKTFQKLYRYTAFEAEFYQTYCTTSHLRLQFVYLIQHGHSCCTGILHKHYDNCDTLVMKRRKTELTVQVHFLVLSNLIPVVSAQNHLDHLHK